MESEKKDGSLDLLRDEYKILQDKMDKIGAFRFTIRGWSVTAVLGGFLAGSGVKTLPIPLICISVFFALWFFWYFEKKQVVYSNRFIGRAKQVEGLIKKHEGMAFVGPAISQRFGRRSERTLVWFDLYLPTTARLYLLRARRWWAVWWEASALFYLVFMALSLVPYALILSPGPSTHKTRLLLVDRSSSTTSLP